MIFFRTQRHSCTTCRIHCPFYSIEIKLESFNMIKIEYNSSPTPYLKWPLCLSQHLISFSIRTQHIFTINFAFILHQIHSKVNFQIILGKIALRSEFLDMYAMMVLQLSFPKSKFPSLPS